MSSNKEMLTPEQEAIMQERRIFVEKMRPHVDTILFKEDGYMKDALSPLTKSQRGIFSTVTLDLASILIDIIPTQQEIEKVAKLDVSLQMKFVRAGIKDPETVVRIAKTAANNLITAFKTDPFIRGDLT